MKCFVKDYVDLQSGEIFPKNLDKVKATIIAITRCFLQNNLNLLANNLKKYKKEFT